MSNKETFYLSSLESSLLELPRECHFEREIHFDTGKRAILAKLDPPVQVQNGGSWSLVNEVILSARHEGHDLIPIRYYPCFVYVAALLDGDISLVSEITTKELTVIGIGELYRTENDATHHVFDKEKGQGH